MGQSKIPHLDDSGDLAEIHQIVLRVVSVIVSQDERLLAVEAPGDLKPSLPEAKIAQMPNGVFLSDCRIPSTNKFFVVFFNTRELPARLLLSDFDDPFVVEMRIGNEEGF